MRHPTGGTQTTDWKKVRLLVFGLDDQFRFLARQTFRKLMVADVTTFSELSDTGALLGKGCDLLLLDLASCPETALKVLEAIRRPPGTPHEKVPVLVVAPSTFKADLDHAKALGIEGILPKPISGHELSHRVAETLAAPTRMAGPAHVAERPKRNALVEPEALPDLGKSGPVPVVMASGAPVESAVEVKALAERLAARASGGTPVAVNAPRPDRGGPWSDMGAELPVKVPSPAPVSSPTPAPVPAPVPAPQAPKPLPAGGGGAMTLSGTVSSPGGRLDAGDLAPAARKPSGGKLELDDLAPARPTGGKLSADDLAGLTFDPDAEAKRKAAEKRRKQWQEAMAATGRKKRKGGDVAGLDLSAVVAEHGVWLTSNGAEGKRATFSGMDLAGADLTGALLPNATFKEVDLSDACLAEARLDGSDFRYAKLEAADLAGANLGVAALRHAKLRLSNLEGAIFRGSDLSGAILTGARTAGADFKGAILIGADLTGADLSKAEGLTTTQVEKSLCDMETRMPPGVSRPARGQ